MNLEDQFKTMMKEAFAEVLAESEKQMISLVDMPDTILNGKQACDILGCSYPTLINYIDEGVIQNFSKKCGSTSVSLKQALAVNMMKVKGMRHRSWKLKNGYLGS